MSIVTKIDNLKGKKHYTFGDFVELIHILRQPEGCPWDREQTHASIRKSFIEETYEAVEAIDKNDMDLLKEELGDVMLQVLLHSEMETEQGTFTINDVIDDECKKMIYRHPHVFGEVSVDSADKVLDNWDKLKKAEKHQQTGSDTLKSVASSLPSLMRVYKLIKKAGKAGLDCAGARDRLYALSQQGGSSEEYVGALLFEAAGIAAECGIEPEEALTRTAERFIKSFEKAEQSGNIGGIKELEY